LYKPKSLVQIPSRFAIEMTNRGWILRNELIWHKPSCMPASVTDRFTVDFEKLFFFTKNKKYYFKQQFEPITESSRKRAEYGWDGTHAPGRSCNPEKGVKMGERWANPKGRNKRTVWSINTASFKGAHFAVYPPELIESPIDAGCPLYVCTKCEKPREVILESLPNPKGISGRAGKPMVSKDGVVDNNDGTRLESGHNPTQFTNSKFVGYTDCGCGEDFVPGVVLDPFFGSGTTAEVAMKQDKNWVGIELNDDYTKISDKRLKPTMVESKTRKKASEFWN